MADGFDWGINLDTGQVESKLPKVKKHLQDIRSEMAKLKKESKESTEQFGEGLEHAFHHSLRGLGLGSLVLGAGAAGLLGSALYTAMDKSVEYFTEKMNEMKRQMVEAGKVSMEQAKASGSTPGITPGQAYHIAKLTGGTPEEAAKMGAQFRSMNKGATDEQIAAGIEAVNNIAPTAEGAAEAAGEMTKLGIPLENIGKLNAISGGNLKKVAEYLKKNERALKARHADPIAFAYNVAHDIDTVDDRLLDRAIHKDLAKPGDGAEKLANYQVFDNPEVQSVRAQAALDRHAQVRQMDLARYHHLAEKQIIMAALQKAYPGYWGSERVKKEMDHRMNLDLPVFERAVANETAYKMNDNYDHSILGGVSMPQYKDTQLSHVLAQVTQAINRSTEASTKKSNSYTTDATQDH